MESSNKTYTHGIKVTFHAETKPYWEQLGYKTLEDWNNATILIDRQTCKKYDINGKEIKDGIK